MVLLEQERADVKGQEYPDHLRRNVIICCTGQSRVSIEVK